MCNWPHMPFHVKKKRAICMLSHTEAIGWTRIFGIMRFLMSLQNWFIFRQFWGFHCAIEALRNTTKTMIFNTEPSDYNKATCFPLKLHVCRDLYSMCVLLCLWTVILMSHMQSSSKSQLCKEKCHTEKFLVWRCFIVLWTSLPLISLHTFLSSYNTELVSCIPLPTLPPTPKFNFTIIHSHSPSLFSFILRQKNSLKNLSTYIIQRQHWSLNGFVLA